MEKMEVAAKGTPTIMIDCSPQQLRDLAEQMEKGSANAMPGTSMVWQLTKNVSVHFKITNNFKFTGSTYRDSDQQSRQLISQ